MSPVNRPGTVPSRVYLGGEHWGGNEPTARGGRSEAFMQEEWVKASWKKGECREEIKLISETTGLAFDGARIVVRVTAGNWCVVRVPFFTRKKRPMPIQFKPKYVAVESSHKSSATPVPPTSRSRSRRAIARLTVSARSPTSTKSWHQLSAVYTTCHAVAVFRSTETLQTPVYQYYESRRFWI